VASQKPRKVGRPKVRIGGAKGKDVPIRFSQAEIKQITAAARKLNPEHVKER
jgi:hypothetical protein